MKKRLLAMILALVLVLGMLPVSVIAEGEHVHCLCGETTVLGATCSDCNTEAVEWTAWDGTTELKALPSGNYYLTKDIELTAVQVIGTDIAIDLCGHNITGNGCRFVYIDGKTMSITDCTGNGVISGFANSGNNPAISIVNSGSDVATLKIYGGKIQHNSSNTANAGVINVTAGSAFYMYGGEISENDVVRGTVKGGTTAAAYTIAILGGTITGNTASGTGGLGGGAGIYSFNPVIVGGDAKVFGNTGDDATKCQDIFLRNDGDYTGGLILADEKPLKSGAQINYGLYTAEADPANLTAISGDPADWNVFWCSYNGKNVDYADGKFFVDTAEHHVHCLCGKELSYGVTCSSCGSKASEWTAWDGSTELKTLEAGNYYLTQDVTVAAVQVIGVDMAIDLCGHTITGSGKRFFYISGGTMSITDCSENPGKITGFANENSNGPFTVSSGSVLNLYNGKISGNTVNSSNCGVITVTGGAEFNMYGGEISGNTAVRGAIKGGTTAAAYTIRILGGTITGNTGTGSGGLGGGAGVYSFSPVTVGGDAKVYGNTGADAAKNQDIFLRNDGTYTGKLIISSQKPLNAEAQVNYGLWTAEADLTNLQKITGSPSEWKSTWVSYEGQKVGYDAGKFFIDTSAPTDHIHCLCGAETNAGRTCAKCGTKADVWTATDTMPAKDAPGWYYLTGNVSAPGYGYASGEFALCLCGHNITAVDGKRTLENYTTFSITDCAEKPGKITGGNGTRTYGLIRVNAGGVLNFYNGHITGNTATDEGIVYLDGSNDAAVAGGTFNMYGGEISGNTTRRGAVYAVLTGTNKAVVRILGGTITGNTGTGTGNRKGGAGVYSFVPVEIGGDAKIYGNTAKEGGADLFIRNDGTYTGKVVVSSEVPLTGDANVHYSLWSVEAEPTDLKFITGSPENWGMGWVTYDGEEVGYKDGKFYTAIEYIYSTHDHDGHKWISMTNANGQVPAASGHYVLDEDVTLPSLLTLSGVEITLCLNGHTLTAAENAGHFDLQPGTKLTICDCAGGGVITGGKGANGGVIRAREGSEVYLYGGTITGNTTAGNGGFIYMNAASATQSAAAFYMYGGTICDNYGAMGAAIRLGAPSGELAGPTFIMEGGTICDNESPTNGGAIHAAGGGTIKLRGGVIEGNIANNGGAISINGNTKVELSGTIIRDNTAKSAGGGMYMVKGVLDMSGGAFNDNTAGGNGGGVLIVETEANLTGGEISGNHSAGGGGMNIQGCEVLLGKVTISDNVSTGSSGGIYICRSGSINSYVTIDGAQIIGNQCKTSGGGIFVYMNGNVLTMEDGLIAENKANDGGGVLIQRTCTFNMNGGEIRDNRTVANGGGVYASIDSIFNFNGGKIIQNYAGKNGGGVYTLRSTVKLNSGAVTGNIAQNSVGGVYFSCSTGEINGTWITCNRALEGSGGGVMLQSATMKVDGVPTKFNTHVVMSAGSISYNSTPKAGAGLLVQSEGSVFDFYGGKISNNTATKFAGGVYVGTKAKFNMHGGAVCYNVTENDIAGGIRHDGGGGNYTGGEIYGNTTTRSGGGIVVGGTNNEVTMKNVKIYDNTAKVGAGVLQQSKGCKLTMEDCEIYNNHATQEGAGLYIYTYCTYTANNCHIHDNTVETNGGGLWSWATSFVYLNNCLIENNQAVKGQGGGIWTRGDGFFINGCTIRNNTAAGDGGGVYAGRMSAASDGFFPHMNVDDTLFEGNTSGGQGGGMYLATGAMGTLKNVTFQKNTAAAEAGAVWAIDEFSMHNVTATENVSGGEGYAVYLDDSDYDGHSYINGLMEMSGNMQIHDNQGGDLYLGKQTVMSITELGLDKETKVDVTLHSGLLTQMVWGAYNYEGGEQIYTITYGDRSIVDPEVPAPEEAPENEPTEQPTEAPEAEPTQQPTEGEQEAPKGKGGLIVGIAATVVVIAAAALIIVLASKKKKSDK